MKICYVLTIDDAGIYADLTYMSVYTVGLSNPWAEIHIVLDHDSHKWLCEREHPLLATPCKYIIVENPAGRTVSGSRYMKTNLRRLIRGDFLFLDSDTVVVKDLRKVFDIKVPFAAAADRNWGNPFPHFPEWHRHLFSALNWPFPHARYLNSGVMLIRDTVEVANLFDVWHSRWQEGLRQGLSVDQPALSVAISETSVPLKVLDVSCNAVVEASPYFIFGAKIIHYYQSQKPRSELHRQFVDLASLVRRDVGTVQIQLKEIVTSPLRLLRYCPAAELITQIPCKPLYGMMLCLRKKRVSILGKCQNHL